MLVSAPFDGLLYRAKSLRRRPRLVTVVTSVPVHVVGRRASRRGGRGSSGPSFHACGAPNVRRSLMQPAPAARTAAGNLTGLEQSRWRSRRAVAASNSCEYAVRRVAVCWSWELASDSKTLASQDLCFLLREDDGAPPSTTRPDEKNLVTHAGAETPHSLAKADRGSSLYQRSTWVEVTHPCTGSSIS